MPFLIIYRQGGLLHRRTFDDLDDAYRFRASVRDLPGVDSASIPIEL